MDTILITVDALRADHLSQYGYNRETMPFLDDIAAEGTLFENVFANGTHTGISLPSLLTSRYLADEPAKMGPTIATALPDNVTSIGIHSNTYFAARVGRPAGFDRFEDFGVADETDEKVRSARQKLFRRVMDRIRPTAERLGIRGYAERVQRTVFPSSLIHESTSYKTAERTTDRALDLISDVDGDLFLWVHYMDPHRPFCMHLDDPAFSDVDLSSDDIHSLMSKAGVKPETVDSKELDLMIDLYDSELRYTSEEIARLVDGLRAQGRWEDAQVIFTADHGEEFGEHGYYFHRNRPYDELIHVPLLVRGPDTNGGRVSEQRELLDVSPTICDAHGISRPPGFLGSPIDDKGERHVVSTGSFNDSVAVVAGRWDGWKYIQAGEETELYDLVEDSAETTNVADENGRLVGRFQREIPERLHEGDHSLVPTDTDDNVKERLTDLGYLE